MVPPSATLSFTGAFVLVRFRLREASKAEHKGTTVEKQEIWSTNPHVAMQRVGYRQRVCLPNAPFPCTNCEAVIFLGTTSASPSTL